MQVVYDRYAARAFGLAYRVSGSRALSEEICQDAFTQLWTQADRFDATRGSGSSFVLTLVHRRAVDAVRREQRNRRDPRPPDADAGGSDAALDALERLEKVEVRRALARLEPRAREALALAYFGGLTYKEVAVRLQQPEGTVKSWLRRALAVLREELDHA